MAGMAVTAFSLLLLWALRSHLQLSNHPDSVADQAAVKFVKGVAVIDASVDILR